VHVIQDVCVVPVDGPAQLPHHDVVVEGDRIAAVRPTGEPAPEGAEPIDGSGRFLIPGLIDTHVHYYGEDENEAESSGAFEVAALNHVWSELCLINGVTTVLCLNGYPEVLELRERNAAGELVGPTIHSAGYGFNDPTMTYEQARAEVANQVAQGYDFVKVYNDPTLDAYRGIVEEAAAQGIRIIGHITRAPGYRGVLEARIAAIAHSEEFLYTAFDFGVSRQEHDWANEPPLRIEDLPRIAQEVKDAGIMVIPNLSAYHAILQQAQDTHAWHRGVEFEGVEPRLLDLWINPPDGRYVQQFADVWKRRNLQEGVWFETRLTEELHRAGVPLTAGSDWGIPGVVPGHLHLELSLLALAGLGNAGALHAATQAGGEFLEPGSGLGTIVPGTRADLVLLDADPLEDVRNAKRISGVMARGRWHSRDELDARHEALREAAARSPFLTHGC
jgi:imidazolonepropionase-like amidohydrolase